MQWKRSVITPVPKKGDLSEPANWRPVNVLPTLAKAFERHVRQALEAYILPKLSYNQFGFLHKRSTEDALMYADHVIRLQMAESLGRKGTVAAISFDIRNAFDVVPFGKLIDCLRLEYNVPSCLLAWLTSYFMDRKQMVKVDDCFSSWRDVKAGVVQGSVIGPLLFVAYFDKVTTEIGSTSIAIKYADDLLLTHPLNSQDDEVALQHAVDKVTQALGGKCLSVNSDKCYFMTISESTRPYLPSSQPLVADNPIRKVQDMNYLGVTIDQRLTWSLDSTKKISKAKKAIGCKITINKKNILY